MSHLPRINSTAIIAWVTSVAAVAQSLPPLRGLIEQSMAWHMAVQMPMLVLAGWCSMSSVSNTWLAHSLAGWNRFGLTGLIAGQGVLAYWMLPLAIDRAVVLPEADAVKIITLFACGAVLKHSFDRAPGVIQVFFVGYTVPMLIWLGFYFATTDLRLCNAYSLSSQVNAGRAVIGLGAALGCGWLVTIFRQSQTLGSRRHYSA